MPELKPLTPANYGVELAWIGCTLFSLEIVDRDADKSTPPVFSKPDFPFVMLDGVLAWLSAAGFAVTDFRENYEKLDQELLNSYFWALGTVCAEGPCTLRWEKFPFKPMAKVWVEQPREGQDPIHRMWDCMPTNFLLKVIDNLGEVEYRENLTIHPDNEQIVVKQEIIQSTIQDIAGLFPAAA